MRRKMLKWGLGVLAGALIVAQFIRPERTNPPSDPSASFEAIAKPPQEVAAVLRRACGDCHSNQTVWPWYSRVAPVSWLVASDVKEGRAELNFSQWNTYSPETARKKLGKICEEVRDGEMPPMYYLPMHRDAKVTPAEASGICALPAGPAR